MGLLNVVRVVLFHIIIKILKMLMVIALLFILIWIEFLIKRNVVFGYGCLDDWSVARVVVFDVLAGLVVFVYLKGKLIILDLV